MTKSTRRTARLSALLSVVVLCATALSGVAGATTTATPQRPRLEGSTITMGAEQFPAVLNQYTPEGNTSWNAYLTVPVLMSGYALQPDFSYKPSLFDKDCTVKSQSPFTVNCTVRAEAKWSDGVPLTAEDFKFTFGEIMNPADNVVSRNGYDQITTFTVNSPTSFDMVFKDVFAPYRELWAGSSTMVFPKHVLEGTDFNTVWNDCICNPKTKEPIGSGPMLLKSFTANSELTLVPNPNYWGPKKATVTVVAKPVQDSNAEVNGFRGGDFDMIYPQPQLGLAAKIKSAPGAKYQSSLGPLWEHFDMRVDVPGLDDINVRKAIATAIPRQAIVDRLVKPTNPKASVLNNTQWMTNQKQYVDHWSKDYPNSGDAAKAKKILDKAGWKMKGGVREKNGVKLSFTVGVTAGNKARELTEQVIQQALKPLGVKLTINNSEDMLTNRLSNFDYQTIDFAWQGGPDPFGGNTIWRSDTIPKACPNPDDCAETGQNYTKIKDAKVTALIKGTDSEVNPKKRDAMYNAADKQMARTSVATIPLYQKPTALGYSGRITGVVDNSTQDGFTWNIAEWRVKK